MQVWFEKSGVSGASTRVSIYLHKFMVDVYAVEARILLLDLLLITVAVAYWLGSPPRMRQVLSSNPGTGATIHI